MEKKCLYLICLFLLLMSSKSYCKEFYDIENHWAKKEIECASENDIINGYDDNTFKPNGEITVAEYLKVLVKSGKFKLIKIGDNLWPDYYINTAKEYGLILENEFYDYNKKLTRNEIARITARYIDVTDVKKSTNKFKDLEKEYQSEILKLVKLEVINGYNDNTYRGQNNVTRAEAITIANRATNARRKIISEKNYDVVSLEKFTNINRDVEIESMYENTRYEIKNNEIIIYDNGKYSKLQGYKVSGDNINLKKVTRIIEKIVDEDSYTGVFYIPVKGILNQLVIMNGENENSINYGNIDFSFTYYEDKPYELKRISENEIFSENCYMKIELLKLWNNISDYNNEIYIDEYKKARLLECLEIEFGSKNAKNILEYMISKNIQRVSRESAELHQAEQKQFGKYIVNYYKPIGEVPKFYIAINE